MFSQYQKPPVGSQVNRGNPLAKGLSVCWLMNEGSGNRIYDLSGNGVTGTFIQHTAWIKEGKGSAINFDGTDDYISAALPISLANKYTFAARVRKNATVANKRVLTLGDSVAGVYPRLVTDMSVPPAEYPTTNNYFCTDNHIVVSDGKPSGTVLGVDGEWLTIVAQFNGAYIEAIYKNGVPGVVQVDAISYGSAQDAHSGIKLGARGSLAGFWNGSISDFMLWNRALSAQEVLQLYQTPYAMFERPVIWSTYATEEEPVTGLANKIFVNGAWRTIAGSKLLTAAGWKAIPANKINISGAWK
jgi:hypothetical protein